ncbi:hypothetical protein QM967_03275 [Streptococcus gordonii]|uniref:hypothetical protein n=1 Tax=Streptococcus gordonii TaxID=1302 RepID=UPI0039C16622
MKRPNKYPYTKSQWEEIKICFNFSDRVMPYILLENTITGEWKDIDEVNHDRN